jgi:alcohol dehydrogenase (cytochrome c)
LGGDELTFRGSKVMTTTPGAPQDQDASQKPLQDRTSKEETPMRRFKSALRAGMLAVVSAATAILPGLSPARADEVTPERLLNADREPGNWLHHHKNFAATRFSSLTGINAANVKNLKVAWTLHLGGVEGGGIWTHGGLEGTPVVEKGFMFVTDGWGSVYKVDTHGGRGALLWKMDPKTDHDWAGAIACCGG